MSDKDLFHAFMDFVNNSLPLRTCASKYKFHSRITNNLLDECESHQLSRSRQEKEPLLDTNNKNRITRRSQERLDLNDINQMYTNWELMNECQIWVLSNASYYQLKSEYVIPNSTLKRYLEKYVHHFSAEIRGTYIKCWREERCRDQKCSKSSRCMFKKIKLEDQLTLIRMNKHWWFNRQIKKVLVVFPLILIHQEPNCNLS